MRSKSVAERPKKEDRTAAAMAGARSLHTAGALSLVRGAEPRTAAMKKPGLY